MPVATPLIANHPHKYRFIIIETCTLRTFTNFRIIGNADFRRPRNTSIGRDTHTGPTQTVMPMSAPSAVKANYSPATFPIIGRNYIHPLLAPLKTCCRRQP